MSRRILRDDAVFVVWFCPDCGMKAEWTPDEFEENGTPVCGECDTDMHYLHTEQEFDG
jgi:predicted RNA-binding Zn-ribbon protein involved in translation (DUF1610 family)